MKKVLSRSLFWLMIVCLLLPSSALAVGANDIVGVWLTPGGKSNVQISKSGNSYVGKLIWLKEPNRNGKPKTDINNQDASLRSRPLKGLSLLSGFTFKGDHWEGSIYNPEDGKTYSCVLYLKGRNLEVRGYVMNPAFGKSQTWVKK